MDSIVLHTATPALDLSWRRFSSTLIRGRSRSRLDVESSSIKYGAIVLVCVHYWCLMRLVAMLSSMIALTLYSYPVLYIFTVDNSTNHLPSNLTHCRTSLASNSGSLGPRRQQLLTQFSTCVPMPSTSVIITSQDVLLVLSVNIVRRPWPCLSTGP